MSSYYVRRSTSYGFGWTGPIRGPRQAKREVDAWRAADHSAELFKLTPEVRAEVRAWERSRREARSRS